MSRSLQVTHDASRVFINIKYWIMYLLVNHFIQYFNIDYLYKFFMLLHKRPDDGIYPAFYTLNEKRERHIALAVFVTFSRARVLASENVT